MTFRILIQTGFILLLLSCNPDETVRADRSINHADSIEKPQTDTQQGNKDHYANIVRTFQKGDTTFIDADYIQFLSGDAAIEAAKKAHQADTFQTLDGETQIGVSDDYFIINESKQLRQLSLARNCVYDLIVSPDRLHPITANSRESFQKIYGDSPFILTINDKGVVVKVKEVFLP